MTSKFEKYTWFPYFKELLMITVGALFYGFGIVAFNIKNNLAEGGITGITLILRAWWGIDPSYSTIILNAPLIYLGYHYLGRKGLLYTIYGTFMLSSSLWIWQRVPMASQINLNHDLFIAGILAGVFGGFGSGLIYRFGGTTGGTDVLARIMELTRGIPMGRSLLALDTVVLLASLSYIDIEHMMYTLLASFVFTRIVDATQTASYAAKGLLIVSDHYNEIAEKMMSELERGITYLNAEGGYHRHERRIIYCVVAPSEVAPAKRLVNKIDENAFISIFDVNEVVGEGFSYSRKSRHLF